MPVTSGIRRGTRRFVIDRVDGPGYFPTNADEMRTAMGGVGTWGSIWQCDEASGNLADRVGGVSLVPSTSPTYQNRGPFGGGLGLAVGFDAGETDVFLAASSTPYNLAANSSLGLYIVFKGVDITNRNFFGKVSASTGYAIQGEVGKMQSFVADGTASVINIVNANHDDDKWHDALYCIDREGQIGQLFTDLGQSTPDDISGVASPSNGGTIRIGAFTNVFNLKVAFAAVTVLNGDVQNLRNAGREAIRNFRRFTGRA